MNSLDFLQKINDIDDDLIQSSAVLLYEEDNMKKNTFFKGGSTLSKIILVAAIISGIICVTAFAAEIFPSIFGQLNRKYAEIAADCPSAQEEADLYKRAAAVNETFEAEYVPLPELDESQIVIGETYYDGPNFLIAYRLDQTAVPAQFGFGPDSESFVDMNHGGYFCENRCDSFEEQLECGCLTQELYDEYVARAESYGLGFLHHYSALSAVWKMQRYLSEEEYDRAIRVLRETGHVGVVMREMHVGDGILVEGADRLKPNKNGELYDEEVTEYGRVIYCNVFDEILPEKYKGRDTLTLTLTVRASDQYVYIDRDTGGWMKAESAGEILVPVTLTKTAPTE